MPHVRATRCERSMGGLALRSEPARFEILNCFTLFGHREFASLPHPLPHVHFILQLPSRPLTFSPSFVVPSTLVTPPCRYQATQLKEN